MRESISLWTTEGKEAPEEEPVVAGMLNGTTGEDQQQQQQIQSVEPTLTPSPVSSSTTTTEQQQPLLPFSLASRFQLLEQPQHSNLILHPSASERPASAAFDSLDPHNHHHHHHHHHAPTTSLLNNHLNHPQFPIPFSHSNQSGLATDRMRSLDILDHHHHHHHPHSLAAAAAAGDQATSNFMPREYPGSFNRRAEDEEQEEDDEERRGMGIMEGGRGGKPEAAAEEKESSIPKNKSIVPAMSIRGGLRIHRPIQPIEGPPPPVLHKTKGPWHKDEDAALLYWVSHLGTGKWVDIAKRVGSRSGKQCRERWTNQLSPEIDHSAFRHDEDMVIITMQQSLQANRWCEVAKHLPGRPENAIKNRWNSRDLQRKRNELLSSSVVNPFAFMLGSGHPHPSATPGRSPVSTLYNGHHLSLGGGSSPIKRARGGSADHLQPSSTDQLHHRLGLPYQSPRNNTNTAHQPKKHRPIIQPASSASGHHRNLNLLDLSSSASSDSSSSPTAKLQSPFNSCHPENENHHQQQQQLVTPNNLLGQVVQLNTLINSSNPSQAAENQEWNSYRPPTGNTPPSTSTTASSNPSSRLLRQSTGNPAGSSQPALAQYYSTPIHSPTYLLPDCSSANSLSSTSDSSGDPHPHHPHPHYHRAQHHQHQQSLAYNAASGSNEDHLNLLTPVHHPSSGLGARIHTFPQHLFLPHGLPDPPHPNDEDDHHPPPPSSSSSSHLKSSGPHLDENNNNTNSLFYPSYPHHHLKPPSSAELFDPPPNLLHLPFNHSPLDLIQHHPHHHHHLPLHSQDHQHQQDHPFDHSLFLSDHLLLPLSNPSRATLVPPSILDHQAELTADRQRPSSGDPDLLEMDRSGRGGVQPGGLGGEVAEVGHRDGDGEGDGEREREGEGEGEGKREGDGEREREGERDGDGEAWGEGDRKGRLNQNQNQNQNRSQNQNQNCSQNQNQNQNCSQNQQQNQNQNQHQNQNCDPNHHQQHHHHHSHDQQIKSREC
ncbi:hypothetical protein PGT21_022007 [Puccinia graminis f. sp. tritici]|uniref:Uncharacterized protein n=1 Tax=Puccinia graminis f. sp. tritici TaxID=56615 RepID=A0A5B0M365_PUCGR|nr:hypothetical protein PGT21_022007 [Puccinia graminis f. sp. tritici]